MKAAPAWSLPSEFPFPLFLDSMGGEDGVDPTVETQPLELCYQRSRVLALSERDSESISIGSFEEVLSKVRFLDPTGQERGS